MSDPRPSTAAGAPQDAWLIHGGRPLSGVVRPSGSKNGALPTLAAALLLDGETILRNVPDIMDVRVMLELLRALGLHIEAGSDATVRITNTGLTTHRPPAELVGKMRGSHYLLAPCLVRLGKAELPHTGGCTIGARPLDYLLRGLIQMGADCLECNDRVEVSTTGLVGTSITLDPVYRSPGATFTLLMAAARIPGVTVIENASCEPDVMQLCDLLTAAGAVIEGVGTTTLTIHGAAQLHGVTHAINSDRLEAGTFLCAAAATRGEVFVAGITCQELGAIAGKLTEAGVDISEERGGVRARCPGPLHGVDIITEPFPLFPTDLQPPLAAVLATAEGTSSIHETIYDHRLQYAPELAKMGANIHVINERNLEITGVARLHGASVTAGNIRDGAALLVAALGADGTSKVSGRKFVARGYADIEGKLRALGADITILDHPHES